MANEPPSISSEPLDRLHADCIMERWYIRAYALVLQEHASHWEPRPAPAKS